MKQALLLLILFTSITYSQDTIYLKKNYKKIDNIKKAEYYKLINPSTDHESAITEKIFYLNDKIKIEKTFEKYYSNNPELIENIIYYDNGQIHIKSEYKNGKLNGEFVSHWENGKLKRKDFYKKGKLKDGTCWNNNGEKVEYYDFEIHPEFPGGTIAFQKYMQDNLGNIEVPDNLKGSKVIIKFTIDESGKITNPKVKKSINPQIDKVALKIVNEMPNWKPAKQDGNPVKVTRSIPIIF